MKPITIILLSVLILCSCRSNHKNQTKTQNVENTIVENRIVPVPSGNWISVDYLNALLETRSPRTAEQYFKAVCLPTRTGISAVTNRMIPGHSRVGFLKSRNADYDFELVSDRAGIFGIKVISDKKIRIRDEYFIKIGEFRDDSADFLRITSTISGMLFGGKYTDGKNTIEFHRDGTITGLENFSTYRTILLAFTFDERYTIDAIYFDWDSRDSQRFGFKFDADTLFLYELVCLEYTYALLESTEDYSDWTEEEWEEWEEPKMCVNSGFGELKFKLWRK